MRRRCLVDTHILIHLLSDAQRLVREVKNILDDYGNQLYVSSASIEEAIHLQQAERISVPQWKTAADIVEYVKTETRFGIKYVAEEHLQTLAKLPLLKKHTDPFDRIIIAHALTEGLTLISSDTEFPRYTKYGLDLIFNDC